MYESSEEKAAVAKQEDEDICFDNELSPSFKDGHDTKSSELRYRRQKYCLRWEKEFPWLRKVADSNGDAIGKCINCNTKLICKKSHLVRHQNSYKHQRLSNVTSSKTERNITSSQDSTAKNSNARDDIFMETLVDNYDNFDDVISSEQDTFDDIEIYESKLHKLNDDVFTSTSHHQPTSVKNTTSAKRLDRSKLLNRISRERSILNEYFSAREAAPQTVAKVEASPTPKKDNIDLFFESVCVSVKTLPPKLAAELKSRVQSILTEYEIRAICEREAFLRSATNEAVGESSEEIVTATTNNRDFN